MKKEISIAKWIENFDKGKYNNPDVDTQIDAGWYDWFCQDSSLRNKTYKLAPKIKQIAKLLGNDFCKTHYVFFKNNCPMYGTLYDDFRFCDIKESDVIYTITPKIGHNSSKNKSSVWGIENEFNEALIEGTWKEVINFFKNKVKS